MTAGEIYNILVQHASRIYDGREAESIARYIMSERFGMDRLRLALEREREIADVEGWETLLAQLGAGRPVQYITATAPFCGLNLAVEEGVLIPRPESEELVGWIASESPAGPAVLDIGTGSGAIAIALAAKIDGAAVTATDISSDALRIAHRNADAANVDVKLIENDILDSRLFEDITVSGGYDIIVSNPPYIPESERGSMHINVINYEPPGALFVPDEDPLIFYRAIADFARDNLKSAGRLYFEIHEKFAADVAGMLTGKGFTDAVVRVDINGKPRMVRAVKK